MELEKAAKGSSLSQSDHASIGAQPVSHNRAAASTAKALRAQPGPVLYNKLRAQAVLTVGKPKASKASAHTRLGFSLDDSCLSTLREDRRYEPEHTKMLRKPPTLYKSKRMEALERIAKPHDAITLEGMEAAFENQPLNVEELQEQLLEGRCAAIRFNSSHVSNDQVLAIVDTVEAVIRLGPATATATRLEGDRVEPQPTGDGVLCVCVDVYGQYLSGIGGESLLASAAALPHVQYLSLNLSAFPNASVPHTISLSLSLSVPPPLPPLLCLCLSVSLFLCLSVCLSLYSIMCVCVCVCV